MNKLSVRFLSVIVLAFLISACHDDDSGPRGKYEHGAFIMNEGGSSSTGSVTFYNTSTAEVEASILRLNGTNFAGLYPQSLTFSGDKSYLVVGGDNKIAIADANTFESLGTIADPAIVTPRYIEVINDKAYISVWGPYDANYSLIDSYVLVYDLKTNTIVKKIDTHEGTECLVYNGNYLFASNYNSGSSRTLAVINPTDNSLVKQIELSSGPNGMVLDANNKLWVACIGGWGATSGKLYRINPSTLTIEATINVTGSLDGDIAVSADKQNVLYTVNNAVYQVSATASQAATQPLFTFNATAFYAFNVDPSTGDIWIADALNYSSPGKISVFSSTGTLKTSFDAGIVPGQIVFK